VGHIITPAARADLFAELPTQDISSGFSTWGLGTWGWKNRDE